MNPLPSGQSSDSRVTVSIARPPAAYPIEIVTNGLASFGAFARTCLEATWSGKLCHKALIVTDEHVSEIAAEHAARLRESGFETATSIIPPGERSKSLDRAGDLFDELIKLKADRHTLVVAIGGGVVGDLGGFVAATYARGLPLLMTPTSLLAQVDSSVGGKVGVNHVRAKNIIGAFHQPIGVWIDTAALDSLPAREMRCGLAEVVKYGMILDAELFAYLEDHSARIMDSDSNVLRHLIARSCALKASVVAQDEREQAGVRDILNFGHTIGHAIEAVAGYGGAFQHGEAVAVGMVAECRLAEQLGWHEASVTDRLVRLLERFELPTSARGLDKSALLEAMTRDKKNRGGRIRFVLPRAIGRVESTSEPTDVHLERVLC